jgi:hypothetical protein
MSDRVSQVVANLPVADGVAVTRGALVKLLSTGYVAESGAGETTIGIANDEAPSSGEQLISVTPLNSGGVLKFIAAGAITRGDELELAANGKVDTYSAGVKVGFMCLSSDVAADGDLCLAVPVVV